MRKIAADRNYIIAKKLTLLKTARAQQTDMTFAAAKLEAPAYYHKDDGEIVEFTSDGNATVLGPGAYINPDLPYLYQTI